MPMHWFMRIHELITHWLAKWWVAIIIKHIHMAEWFIQTVICSTEIRELFVLIWDPPSVRLHWNREYIRKCFGTQSQRPLHNDSDRMWYRQSCRWPSVQVNLHWNGALFPFHLDGVTISLHGATCTQDRARRASTANKTPSTILFLFRFCFPPPFVYGAHKSRWSIVFHKTYPIQMNMRCFVVKWIGHKNRKSISDIFCRCTVRRTGACGPLYYCNANRVTLVALGC